jgi:P2 family phage contractile tail tube protein
MPVSSYLRKFVVYVDGFGKAGDCDGATLPKLTLKMDEYRGGGMDVPVEVDLGMEKLEFEFTMTSLDDQVIDKFGLYPGNQKSFTLRGSLSSHDGTSMAVVANMRGTLKSVDMGQFQAGEKMSVTFMVTLDYYKLIRGDRTLVEIDIENCRRIIGGIDQLEADRVNLGL